MNFKCNYIKSGSPYLNYYVAQALYSVGLDLMIDDYEINYPNKKLGVLERTKNSRKVVLFVKVINSKNYPSDYRFYFEYEQFGKPSHNEFGESITKWSKTRITKAIKLPVVKPASLAALFE